MGGNEPMKPEGTRYRATTQVKVLSLEILIMSEVDAVYGAEDSSLTGDKRGSKTSTGLRPWHGIKRTSWEIGRPATFHERVWTAAYRRQGCPNDVMESDQCIVP